MYYKCSNNKKQQQPPTDSKCSEMIHCYLPCNKQHNLLFSSSRKPLEKPSGRRPSSQWHHLQYHTALCHSALIAVQIDLRASLAENTLLSVSTERQERGTALGLNDHNAGASGPGGAGDKLRLQRDSSSASHDAVLPRSTREALL